MIRGLSPLSVVNCKWVKLYNQRIEIGRMDRKNMIQLYAMYKKLTLKPKTQTD